MTDQKKPDPRPPSLTPHARCGYHNENGEQCEKLAGHQYVGSDPKLVGTNCTVGGVSFDGPEAAKRMRSRLIFLRGEKDAAERARDKAVEEHAKCDEKFLAQAAAWNKGLSDRERQHFEANKRIQTLESEARAANIDLKDAQQKHTLWAARVEQDTAAHKAAQQAWQEEKEALLLRLATLAEKLDWALTLLDSRADAPRADPWERCESANADERCVMRRGHAGWHRKGGMSWDDPHEDDESRLRKENEELKKLNDELRAMLPGATPIPQGPVTVVQVPSPPSWRCPDCHRDRPTQPHYDDCDFVKRVTAREKQSAMKFTGPDPTCFCRGAGCSGCCGPG